MTYREDSLLGDRWFKVRTWGGLGACVAARSHDNEPVTRHCREVQPLRNEDRKGVLTPVFGIGTRKNTERPRNPPFFATRRALTAEVDRLEFRVTRQFNVS